MTHAEDISRALAGVVREKRTERGVSQRELAESTGLPLVTISRKERGLSPYNYLELAMIAEALGSSVTDLSLSAERRASRTAA